MRDLQEARKEWSEYVFIRSRDEVVGFIDRAIAAEKERDELQKRVVELENSIKKAHLSLTWSNTENQVPHAVWHLEQAVKEHLELLHAIHDGDPDRAEDAMRRHVAGFEEAIRRVL